MRLYTGLQRQIMLIFFFFHFYIFHLAKKGSCTNKEIYNEYLIISCQKDFISEDVIFSVGISVHILLKKKFRLPTVK